MIHVLLTLELPWQHNDAITFFTALFLGTRIFLFQKSLKGACTSHSCLGSGKVLACENIRFSTLFAAVDVSHGGKSATQRQKFHTDDVKYVRNPVRSPDWSKE